MYKMKGCFHVIIDYDQSRMECFKKKSCFFVLEKRRQTGTGLRWILWNGMGLVCMLLSL